MKTNPNDLLNSTLKSRLCEDRDGYEIVGGGLTKREYFAIQIYSGMSSIPDNMECRKMSAGLAVECADYLIAELNKDKNEQK